MSKLLLLSGGLDSTLIAYTDPDIRLCIGVDYGQPHAIELEKADATAERLDLPFYVIHLPTIPKVNDVVFAGRNAVLLSVAASVAQVEGLTSVVIGCNRSDAERFPDCRPEFIDAMNSAFKSYGITVETPLISMSKSEVVIAAREAGVEENMTLTCYAPVNGKPCGVCYSCKGLENAKIQG